MDSNYKATIIAAISYAIVTFGIYITWIFVAPVTLIGVMFFEGIANLIFGPENHYFIAVISLVSQIVLLFIACFWYYRILIRDKEQNREFNQKGLIIFYTILQFIVHPAGCYIWLLLSGNIDSHHDPIEMAAYKISLTIPFSGILLVILGLAIDLIWNRKSKGQEDGVL